MSNHIDLHTHTNASDGELSPESLIDRAIKKGVVAIAITDHDTVDGIEPALNYARDKDVELIPGVELGCSEKELGFDDIHILGLFIDHKNKALLNLTESIKLDRTERIKKIIEKLNALGFGITFEEIASVAKGSIGRVHVAKILTRKYPNKIISNRDAFMKYLEEGRLAFVSRPGKISVKDAISLIKEAGGIPILAHPGVYSFEDAAELIERFVELGGQGLETAYPYSKINRIPIELEKQKNYFCKEQAKKHDLLESGGSDFHGSIRPIEVGELPLRYNLLLKLKDFISKREAQPLKN